VQMYLEQDGQRIDIPPRMTVQGSGAPGPTYPSSRPSTPSATRG
jgi:hypothetical protein